jgi:hypothetical protein
LRTRPFTSIGGTTPRARDAKRDQEEPLEIPRFRDARTANNSAEQLNQQSHEFSLDAAAPKIPSEQGIFRDLTGNFVCPETARQAADRQWFGASARAASASVGGREA